MEAALATLSAAEQQMLSSRLDAAVGGALVQSRDYMTLLAVCHAVCAQQVHSRTRGTASAFPEVAKDTAAAAAAGAGPAAPAASKRLLRLLGVAGSIVAPHSYDDDDVVALMHGSCTALQQTVQCMLRNAGLIASAPTSSSSSSAPRFSTAAVAAVLSSAVVEAWVQTLVELVLLLSPQYKGAPVAATGVVMQAARSLVDARALGPDGRLALDACKSRLFKPLLHQLLPDAWHALRCGKTWSLGTVDKHSWQLMLEQGLCCVLVETLVTGKHMTI
jgi:hypothetical protein